MLAKEFLYNKCFCFQFRYFVTLAVERKKRNLIYLNSNCCKTNLHQSVMKMFAGGMDRTIDNIADLWCNRINTISSTNQPAFTYSKLTIETLEQGVKYVQS